MPGLQPTKAKQVDSLGETPAEARARMQSSGASAKAATSPSGIAGASPRHIAAMREQEGFGGGPTEGGTVEDAPDLVEPPTPSKAMESIRQLSQDKLQLQSELDAALNQLQRYRATYGELD